MEKVCSSWLSISAGSFKSVSIGLTINIMGYFYSRPTQPGENKPPGPQESPQLSCLTHTKPAVGFCVNKACSRRIAICVECISGESDKHTCSMVSAEELRASLETYLLQESPLVSKLQATLKEYYVELNALISLKLR